MFYAWKGERPRHPNAPAIYGTGEIKLETEDRASGYWITRSDADSMLNARTSGVYLRAEADGSRRLGRTRQPGPSGTDRRADRGLEVARELLMEVCHTAATRRRSPPRSTWWSGSARGLRLHPARGLARGARPIRAAREGPRRRDAAHTVGDLARRRQPDQRGRRGHDLGRPGKIHLFDPATGENLTMDASNAGIVPGGNVMEEAEEVRPGAGQRVVRLRPRHQSRHASNSAVGTEHEAPGSTRSLGLAASRSTGWTTGRILYSRVARVDTERRDRVEQRRQR